MSLGTYRNVYRSHYRRARRGPGHRVKQGADGILAGLVLAIIISLAF